jgi:hypothetical protein
LPVISTFTAQHSLAHSAGSLAAYLAIGGAPHGKKLIAGQGFPLFSSKIYLLRALLFKIRQHGLGNVSSDFLHIFDFNRNRFQSSKSKRLDFYSS